VSVRLEVIQGGGGPTGAPPQPRAVTGPEEACGSKTNLTQRLQRWATWHPRGGSHALATSRLRRPNLILLSAKQLTSDTFVQNMNNII
jgi:hypothetical protein